MTKLLQRKYREFKVISSEMDRIEAIMDEELDNEAIEEEFDNYYANVYFPKHEELVELISKVAKCEMKVARSILASDKFESLMSLTIA